MNYTKRDFFLSMLSGFITGFLGWLIFSFLKVSRPFNLSLAWLMLVVPILWVIGVWAGFYLGKWISFFQQFGKFAAIGLTNFVVDIGILNLLMAWSGHTLGAWYALFKGIAFMAAGTHSFFWNKYWTFGAGQCQGGGGEFGKFMAVNLVAAGVNVGVATFVANGVNPPLSFSPQLWATAAAVVGSAVALVFSFVGSRLLVFKKS